MSIGPLPPILSSAAGAPLSQTSGAESERTKKDASAQHRQADAELKAENAAGIGQTAEDQQTSDRDADGRRLWEGAPDSRNRGAKHEDDAAATKQARDPRGESGNQLDLTG